MADQEQAPSTKVIRSKIFNLLVSSLCRLCSAADETQDETVDHLISFCHYIAQSQYKKCHDIIESYIHWMLSWNSGEVLWGSGGSTNLRMFWRAVIVNHMGFYYLHRLKFRK